MKLYEAIRLGAMIHPQQGFNQNYTYDEDGNVVASCALGAATTAVGLEQMALGFQDVLDLLTVCPSMNHPIPMIRSIRNTIIHLNDHHHWTREAIADWLEREVEHGNTSRVEDEESSMVCTQ